MNLQGPKSFSGHSTHISIIAGKAMPRTDRQSAPKREINKPSLGTDIAKITEMIKVLISFDLTTVDFFRLFNFNHVLRCKCLFVLATCVFNLHSLFVV